MILCRVAGQGAGKLILTGRPGSSLKPGLVARQPCLPCHPKVKWSPNPFHRHLGRQRVSKVLRLNGAARGVNDYSLLSRGDNPSVRVNQPNVDSLLKEDTGRLVHRLLRRWFFFLLSMSLHSLLLFPLCSIQGQVEVLTFSSDQILHLFDIECKLVSTS